jgi:hypothetical protein
MFPALVIPLYIVWCLWSEGFWLLDTGDFIIFSNHINKFSKNLKKYFDIVNDVIYKHAKINIQFFLYCGLHKMASDKKWRLENMHTHIYMCVIIV